MVARRLVDENGEWPCCFPSSRIFPWKIDDTADARHETLPLGAAERGFVKRAFKQASCAR